jgi:3-oxoisoapionate decarboxylase
VLPGISSYSLPWAVGLQNDIAGKIQLASKLVEMAIAHQVPVVQFGDNLPLHQFTGRELLKLKQLADNNGIHIEVGTRGLREVNILQYLHIAQQVASPFIRMVIDEEGYQPAVEKIIAAIRNVLPALKDAGIVLAIENHDRFTAADLQHIILQTDTKWVGICMDTANSFGAGEGVREIVQVLAPYTINVHVKDFIIKRVEHKMGFTIEGTACGEGMLDIPWLITELKKTGTCKTATLEIWSNALEAIGQTVQREKEWFEKSIDYLKTIIA